MGICADLAYAWLDLVLPQTCAGCEQPGAPLCRSCRAGPVVDVDVDGLLVVAATTYAGAVRTALLAYKERGRGELGRPFGELLVRAARSAAVPGGTALVPVPSSARARRLRGRNHLDQPVRVLARATGATVEPLLTLNRPVRDSAGLSARDRARNLDRGMTARPGPSRRPVVLVDDIVTTGSTLLEAARALTAAGRPPMLALVVAATPAPGAG